MKTIEELRLQSRILKVKMKNPIALTMFFDKYPDYKDKKDFIYNIYNLRTTDLFVTEKFESLL